MSKLYRSIALLLMLAMVFAVFTGCNSNGGKDANNSAEPTKEPDPSSDSSAEPTAAGDPTEIPQWMWTPDPALYILGEDGFYEDQYLSAYWPAYLEYKGSIYQNCAQYIGYPEGSDKKLVFSYTVDDGAVYEDDFGSQTFESYAEFIQTDMNEYFYLDEFSKIKIDGHDAVKAVYHYDPPGQPEHYTRLLQYSINVNGWVIGLCFSTLLETFPEECITCINTIKFKDGY